MIFVPIGPEYTNDSRITENPECLEIEHIFMSHYHTAGFEKPWIAYFISDDQDQIIGAGGFKGTPRDGKVEITYGIFKNFRNKGIGTMICKELLILAEKMDPSLTIIARTIPENTGSIKILTKNGFEYKEKVLDDVDGLLLEWHWKKENVRK